MNIDEIVQVTENFYNDLIQFSANTQQQSLGDLCLYHVIEALNNQFYAWLY